MSTVRNDLKRLIQFSTENDVEAAIASFSMFSAEQIRQLYDITVSQRRHLLQEWGIEDPAMAHFLHHFHSHRNPAQARKITEEKADPSNNW